MLAPNILTQILPQTIKAARRVKPTIQMILQQKVHTPNIRQLKPVNLPSNVILAKQLPQLLRRQHAAQPVPLVIIPDEQSEIAVGRLVA